MDALTGIEDVAHALRERRPIRQADAETWRPEVAPENTAPEREPISVESWAVPIEQAKAMLARQMCPICGEGPWKSPLTHASKKHGVDRFAMRDVCGLTTTASLTAPDYRAKLVERGRTVDMSAAHEAAKRRGKQRFTSEGLRVLAANLTAFSESEEGARQRAAAAAASKTPEAIAKRSETFRAKRRE